MCEVFSDRPLPLRTECLCSPVLCLNTACLGLWPLIFFYGDFHLCIHEKWRSIAYLSFYLLKKVSLCNPGLALSLASTCLIFLGAENVCLALCFIFGCYFFVRLWPLECGVTSTFWNWASSFFSFSIL